VGPQPPHHRKVLSDKYVDLVDTGWKLTRSEIDRDVKYLMADNFTTS